MSNFHYTAKWIKIRVGCYVNIMHLNSLRSIIFEIWTMEVVQGLCRTYVVPPELHHRISQKLWILDYSSILFSPRNQTTYVYCLISDA